MSNKIYIPPINFNEFDVQTGSTTSINAIEPLEYNKLNSNLSIKVATENNYGVMTTGTQNIRGIKNFVDSISVPSAEVNNVSLTSGTITTSPTNDTDISNKNYVDTKDQELKNLIGDTNEKAIVLTGFQKWYYGTNQYNFNAYVSKYKNKYILKFDTGDYIKSTTSTYESDTIFLSFEGLKGGEFEDLYSYMPNSFTLKAKQKKESKYYNIEAEFEKGTLTYNEITYQGFRMLTKAIGNGFNNLEVKYIDCYFNNSDLSNINKINCTEQDCSTLNVSDNYINKIPVSIMVRTRGSAGTFDKDITIYKTILNGKTSIIFNKNLDFNSYSNTTDASISKNSIILNMTNLSDIFGYLPYEFELTGETSTYGGTKNIATRTLKFKKSPADPYKYDLQYDQSFPFNIFKLKDTIKNSDTIINTTETQKINTLTIDKGYLYNTPTEANNLVNKNYVDVVKNDLKDEINMKAEELNNKADEIKSTLNSNIESAKSELNGNIESTKSELNGNITTAINNISNVNLTTGTISTTPTNDTDITNKKYVVNAIDEVKNGLKEFIKYDNNNKNLYKSTDSALQLINDLTLNNLTSNTSTISDLTATSTTTEDLTTTNLISNDVRINNNLFLGSGILDFKNFPSRKFVNSNSQDLIACSVMFLKIRVGGVIFINLKFDFLPFISDGNSIFMYGLPLSDIGSDSYNGYLNYFSDTNDTNYIKCGRCQYFITKNSIGAYDIEIINTKNGNQIYQFDEIKRVFAIV